MSVESLAIALHHSRAEGTALLVLIGIANHDGDGGAWPKIATLAKYARVKDRAVTNAIATLVKLGEIRVHHNAGGTRTTDDRYRPNLYEFLLSCPSTCKGDKNHTPVDKRDSGVHGGAPLDSSGVHGGTGPGVHHGAPPYEPSFLNRPFGGDTAVSPAGPVDKSAPPRPLPRPERCVDHQLDVIPPNCGRCKDARLTLELVEAEIAHRPLATCEHERVAATCPFCPGRRLADLEEVG
jgi:hypothetical protein